MIAARMGATHPLGAIAHCALVPGRPGPPACWSERLAAALRPTRPRRSAAEKEAWDKATPPRRAAHGLLPALAFDPEPRRLRTADRTLRRAEARPPGRARARPKPSWRGAKLKLKLMSRTEVPRQST